MYGLHKLQWLTRHMLSGKINAQAFLQVQSHVVCFEVHKLRGEEVWKHNKKM